MTKKSSKKAFTLVELIIVIAIIAILAVTAFLLLTKWLAKARDASRSSNLANIENSLQISLTENSSLPKPDSYVLIYASGTTNVIGYQGFFGEGVKDSVGNINSAPKDGDDYFTYYLNADLNKYQLGAFMENEIAYNPNVVSAVDYASRYVNVKGEKLGLLTDSNKSPLQSLGMTGLDLLTGTASYIAYMDNSTNVAGTGKQLFTYYYNKTKSLLQNKDFAKNDDSLVGYWDMETLTGTLLADLSQYGNNGTCKNGNDLVSCGNTGPQSIQGKVGKALQFDGTDDIIVIDNPMPNNNVFSIYVVFEQNNKETLGCIFSKRSDGNEIVLGLLNSYTYFAGWDVSGNYMDIRGDTKKNVFRKLLIVADNNKIKMYLDDRIFTKTFSGDFSSYGSKLYLGRDQNFRDRTLKGAIDEFRIYDRALSDEEVKALYDATN